MDVASEGFSKDLGAGYVAEIRQSVIVDKLCSLAHEFVFRPPTLNSLLHLF
jgi:hypothetical protein